MFFIATLISCRKQLNSPESIAVAKETVQRFLNVPASASPEMLRIAHQLEDLHQKSGFLTTIAQHDGYPVWDKALITSGKWVGKRTSGASNASADTIVYIPLVSEGSRYVGAFIAAQLNDSISLQLHRMEDYKMYGFGNLESQGNNAEKLAVQFMILNYKTFGYQNFNILDPGLFKDPAITTGTLTRNATVTLTQGAGSGITSATSTRKKLSGIEYWDYTVCTSTQYLECTTNHNCCPDGSCAGCQAECWKTSTNCVTTTISVFSTGDDYPTDPGTGGGGGGSDGGTGGSSTTPTCNPTPLIDNGLPPCPKGGTIGWLPEIFLEERVQYLNSQLILNGFFLTPCDKLNIMPLDDEGGYGLMYQRVAQFTPPQSVKDRIEYIKTVAPNWTTDNFNIQNLEDAFGGVVNCDYFAVKISQLPNGMTARLLTELFRKNINLFVDDDANCKFYPYKDGNFDDSPQWNKLYEESLGALIHIDMTNDGSVIESDYYSNSTVGHIKSRFKFSTMETPLDMEHPVAGNREFGVFENPQVPGEFYFYTMGIDRIWDISFLAGDILFDGFGKADKVWTSIQKKMAAFIIANGGQATVVPAIKARPNWSDVREYLKGNITFEELKRRVGC